MTDKVSNIITVTISTVIIAGLVIFFGMQNPNMSQDELAAEINDGIEDYVAEKTKDAQGEQPSAPSEPEDFVEVDMDELSDDDPVKGNEDAKVTIVEFSDYECPFCARYISYTYPQIKENYIDTGKVKYVFRDYPLGFHQNAYPAALAANCVRDQGGDDAYYDFHDKLFADQENLDYNTFVSYVEELGFDSGEFKECYDSDKFKEEIYNDMSAGGDIGITGTPGFIINGHVIRGAYPYETFEEIIEKALAE
ncbi:thioredoxin domain-containing protein [Candidatus Peregrinibacteria bacterium]|nr:thioredoxin domain-containing protein [Candidatus Peregrinibacteria bacterium]